MSYNEANDWSLEIEDEDPDNWKKGFIKTDWNKRARSVKEILRSAALKILIAKHNQEIEEANFYAATVKKLIFKLRDKIIAVEQAKAYSILEDNVREWFRIIGYKEPLDYQKYITQSLIGDTKEIIPEKIFGLGLTTYKSGDIENYQDAAWNITQQIIKELLPQLRNVKVIKAFPTIGYWKGAKEPSTQLILKGELSEFNLQKITAFKEKYHQEAIALFDPLTDIEKKLRNIEEKDLPSLNIEALTYDFEQKIVTVFGKGAKFI